MKIGYIGLGKMGKNMVLRLLEKGIEVVAWNRSVEPLKEVASAGGIIATDIKDLVSKLPKPAIVWLMLTAGDITDQFVDQLSELLKAGDLVIDGGNSFFKDSQRRAEKLRDRQIRFMDIGVSGGPVGARDGACLMIGGRRKDYEEIKKLVVAASAPDAFGYFGEVGSGHFAKMVHNGIEYGMMEAIAEGAAILKSSEFELNLEEIFRVYNNRSVIASRLVGWTQAALQEDPDLKEISSKINSTGEGEWTIKIAKELGVSIPIIEGSFLVRQNSAVDAKDTKDGFRNKVVSAMRGKFGQHQVKKN